MIQPWTTLLSRWYTSTDKWLYDKKIAYFYGTYCIWLWLSDFIDLCYFILAVNASYLLKCIMISSALAKAQLHHTWSNLLLWVWSIACYWGCKSVTRLVRPIIVSAFILNRSGLQSNINPCCAGIIWKSIKKFCFYFFFPITEITVPGK